MAFWNFLPLLFGGGGAAAAAGTAAAGAAATASLAPSLIGAGASLLGGALSARAEKKGIAAQNAYNHPTAIRQRAEEAGFNPLLFIGPGVGQQTAVGGSNYMGSAIANAGMQIADQMSKNQELARLEKLSAENQKLAEKVQTLTIRPKVGGVYAQREKSPLIGPRQPIQVRHAITGKWYNMDPGVGDRLKLSDGDTLLVEDFEAIGGEIYGEIAGTTAMADSALGTGDKAFPKMPKRPVSVTPKRFTTPFGKNLRPQLRLQAP